jgi:hypothetical protein
MAFLGFGQITDPMDPKVQQPIPPPCSSRFPLRGWGAAARTISAFSN